ncbi:hypothetical protein BpHYR1_046280 [Brachionus plicatilis]|uniref:Uncharacterized protein n=1 Tax=Brachionus plicatilis TaxID=10195 RepID=A0A3M7RY17_BRAPC|nr:hypothetical protein BpHYR1_046280 [Brachionus plicatilis]
MKGNAVSLSRLMLIENEKEEDIIFYEGGEEEREYMDSLQDCRMTYEMHREMSSVDDGEIFRSTRKNIKEMIILVCKYFIFWFFIDLY